MSNSVTSDPARADLLRRHLYVEAVSLLVANLGAMGTNRPDDLGDLVPDLEDLGAAIGEDLWEQFHAGEEEGWPADVRHVDGLSMILTGEMMIALSERVDELRAEGLRLVGLGRSRLVSMALPEPERVADGDSFRSMGEEDDRD